jgi:hypothetical protein
VERQVTPRDFTLTIEPLLASLVENVVNVAPSFIIAQAISCSLRSYQ